MAFDGSEGETIPLKEAVEWTARYRDTGAEIRAHFFGRDILQQILAQDKCVGIRIYYALDDRHGSQLFLVGANADEEDLYKGVIAERSINCPPICGKSSPLNGG